MLVTGRAIALSMITLNNSGRGGGNLVLTGKINSVDNQSFMMLEDAPHKASDKVVVKIQGSTNISDSNGKKLNFSDLKAGQRVEVTTLPVMTMMYPAQVRAISVVVR
jgi:hypothetical protein